MSTFGIRLRQESYRNRLYLAIIIVLLPMFWLQRTWDDWRNSLPVRVCVVNGHTDYIGWAIPAMQDDETNVETAKLVAAVVFDRVPLALKASPEGMTTSSPISTLKYPEMLERIVNTPVRNQVERLCALDNNQFIAQSTTQTFNLTQKIIEQRVNDDTVKMILEGDLIKLSKIEGHVETSSQSARISMWITRNDDWAINNKYPKVCTVLQIEYAK